MHELGSLAAKSSEGVRSRQNIRSESFSNDGFWVDRLILLTRRELLVCLEAKSLQPDLRFGKVKGEDRGCKRL